MSQGKFTQSKYQSDATNIYSIRVQPETLLATFGTTINVAPSADVDQEVSAKVSKGNRGIGIKPRTATIKWTAAPDDYDPNTLLRVPILTKVVYDGIVKGQTVSYLGGTGTVASKSPERVG